MYCVKCDQQVIEQRTAPSTIQQAKASDDVLNELATKVLMILENYTRSLPIKPHPEELRTFAAIVKDLVEILRGIRELQG